MMKKSDVYELCRKLGVDPNEVIGINISPSDVEIEIFTGKTTERGYPLTYTAHKRIEDDVHMGTGRTETDDEGEWKGTAHLSPQERLRATHNGFMLEEKGPVKYGVVRINPEESLRQE